MDGSRPVADMSGVGFPEPIRCGFDSKGRAVSVLWGAKLGVAEP